MVDVAPDFSVYFCMTVPAELRRPAMTQAGLIGALAEGCTLSFGGNASGAVTSFAALQALSWYVRDRPELLIELTNAVRDEYQKRKDADAEATGK